VRCGCRRCGGRPPRGILTATLVALGLLHQRPFASLRPSPRRCTARNAQRDATVKLDVTGAVLVTGGLASVIYGVVTPRAGPRLDVVVTIEWIIGGLVALVASSIGSPTSRRTRWCRFASSSHVHSRRPTSSCSWWRCLLCDVVLPDLLLPIHLEVRPSQNRVRVSAHGGAIIVGAQISSRLLVKTGVRPLLLVGHLGDPRFLWIR